MKDYISPHALPSLPDTVLEGTPFYDKILSFRQVVFIPYTDKPWARVRGGGRRGERGERAEHAREYGERPLANTKRARARRQASPNTRHIIYRLRSLTLSFTFYPTSTLSLHKYQRFQSLDKPFPYIRREKPVHAHYVMCGLTAFALNTAVINTRIWNRYFLFKKLKFWHKTCKSYRA